jgi:hypothetical protein
LRERTLVSTTPWLFGIILLILGSSCTARDAELQRVTVNDPCMTAGRSTASWDGTDQDIPMVRPSRLPCDLSFDSSAVFAVAASDSFGVQLKAVKGVLRDGTMLLSSYTAGEMWRLSSATGELARIARPGGGPRELRGTLTVHVGAADSFAVRDDGMMWHRFAAPGAFVDARSAQAVGGLRGESCALLDGTVISTAYRGPEFPAVRAHRFDLSLLGAFNLANLPALAPGGPPVGRRVWCGLSSFAVFAEHPLSDGGQPTLVLWNPIRNTYARVPLSFPWFVGGPLMSGSDALGSRPPSEIREVADLGGGMVLLVVRLSDPNWRESSSRQEQRAAYDQLLDLQYVVVDLQRGTVVAELRVDVVSTAPVDFIPLVAASYAVEQGSDSVRIWRISPRLSSHALQP